jgi:hypothetical protein
MFLINYSKDILYLVLAFCVLWLTFFLAWLVYYLVVSARQIHKATQMVREEVEKISDLIHKIRTAIELPSSIVALIMEGLKKIAEMGMEAFKESKRGARPKRAKNGLDNEKNTEEKEPIF